MNETPAGDGHRSGMAPNDLIDSPGVSEEPRGPPVGIDIRNRIEDKGRREIHERIRIQDSRDRERFLHRCKELAPVTGMTILLAPQ
ncbi:MAG: hypothetical protein OEM97_06320 [Acidimicrobiia bacterium]|nr:hypothetical protein [Acidimicrobiia bacterium]